MTRRGLILAGGTGSRLFPVTRGYNKHLLPIYNKPMIYYPLTTLMLAGIREIHIVTTDSALPALTHLLGDGSAWGISISYAIQPSPRGLADAFLVGSPFLQEQPSAVILGDNLFFGHGLVETLQRAARDPSGATLFAHWVKAPQEYGVAELNASGEVISLEEKPLHPKSHYAVTGLYFYDGQATALAHTLRPSARGELEITDLNQLYLERGQLRLERLGRGYAWLDAGTHDTLLQAGNLIQSLEQRQGLMVACPEEIAFRNGWIGGEDVLRLAASLQHNGYGQSLIRLVREGMP